MSLCLAAAPAAAQGGWPQVFDPTVVLTLHLEMAPTDWTTVQNDTSFSVEVPAQFWADGEAPILVSVRRKSDAALTAAPGFAKVSLRVDINEFVLGQDWRELKKLSLENGADSSPLSEGFAWGIHRLASGTLGYGYDAARAAWVRLLINGIDTGVYVSDEIRDKRLLENRALYVEGQTWLY
ncbi:MAG: CotH kinase family protein, partial [Actinobacteria bacterium]|nr:CotH kinase family protein [Actinomycetota bacterium]